LILASTHHGTERVRCEGPVERLELDVEPAWRRSGGVVRRDVHVVGYVLREVDDQFDSDAKQRPHSRPLMISFNFFTSIGLRGICLM